MGTGRGGNFGKTRGYIEQEKPGEPGLVRNTLEYNAHQMDGVYSLNKNGYFGLSTERGHVRKIVNNHPLESAVFFFHKLIEGVSAEPLPGKKGWMAKMRDGYVVTIREHSISDGSPAVDIHIRGKSKTVKDQKIHFVKE